MHATCKCLNISIKSRCEELQLVDMTTLDLGPQEQTDPFFNLNLFTISELEGIVKEQSSLVETRNVASWIVYRCYNCSLSTHAVNKEYGASKVLINSDVITLPQEIENLKSSRDFSPVFRIIIEQYKTEDLDPIEPLVKFPGLECQLEAAVQKQTRIVDEKIREYTMEQYKILEDFKERAHGEYSYLSKLIYEKSKMNIKEPDNSLRKSNLKQISKESADALRSLRDMVESKEQIEEESTSHVNGKIVDEAGLEGEVFMLEGMEDYVPGQPLTASDNESEENEPINEGIQIPRSHRFGHSIMARSLPVTVPAFNSFSHSFDYEDDDQVKDPIDPNSIHKSIKALAKSVHGDAVFGDLPRPRFSTQI